MPDVTEHRHQGEGKVYCAAVLDVYSRRIVGWSIADHMRSELVVDALQMARWNRQPEPGTIVHADRGAQYTSWIFGHRLREAGLLGSMGRVASSVDNTMMELLVDHATRVAGPATSKASTTRSAATPASTDCPQSTTNTFTTAAAPRHDQHTDRVRRTGSGSGAHLPHSCRAGINRSTVMAISDPPGLVPVPEPPGFRLVNDVSGNYASLT